MWSRVEIRHWLDSTGSMIYGKDGTDMTGWVLTFLVFLVVLHITTKNPRSG